LAARCLETVAREYPERPNEIPQTYANDLAIELALQYLSNHSLTLTLSAAQATGVLRSTHRPEWPARILQLTTSGDLLHKLCHVALSPLSPSFAGGPRYRVIAFRPGFMTGQLLIDPSAPELDWSSSGEECDDSGDSFEQDTIDKLVELIRPPLDDSPAPKSFVSVGEEEEEEDTQKAPPKPVLTEGEGQDSQGNVDE
jgi:hypothetical protein